ncbi:sphingosine kinase 1-like isoform X1 [Macadamia integrifolia]|uniref:sphingosine kinase 1-like isoform X1 n=2 Tax=Macadamia integrifolia TaxID=60698 RepID=UPI001C4E4989|nr:sphingosine kinase 1-like isoform X1 [Macadamia integrifolia]
MGEESKMESHEGGTLTIFEQVRVNGKITPVALSCDGKLRWTENIERCLDLEKEVLSFSTRGSKITIRASVVDWSELHWLRTKGRRRKDIVLEPLSEESRRLWCQKLQEFLDSLDRPKRLFIIVNPFGGKRSAKEIFQEAKPLLIDANIEYTVQESQYQFHAKEMAQTLDLSKYDGIVCVSGDGILVEVVNGLLQRVDWEVAIKMPLGIIPAGSGNGMVKSVLDSVGDPCSVTNAVLTVIRGHRISLDVATILQGETKFFSVLMLAWGLVADIDIESEKFRWMGSSRMDLYALLRILRLRKYNGRISFVPAPGFEAYGMPCDQSGRSKFDLSTQTKEEVKVQQHGYQGPKISLDDLEWRTIDGPFISVWLHNVPWGSEDTMAAPDAKFADGYLDLIVIRDCPKTSLLSLMTEVNAGSHVKSPHVLYLKVKALVLEPGQRSDEPTKGGIIDTDGEVLARGKGTYKYEQGGLMAYGPMQITVQQGLATLYAPR